MIPSSLAIVGGSGFIGRALIARLAVTAGFDDTEIRSVDRLPMPDEATRPMRFHEFLGEADDEEVLAAAFRGVAAVWIRAAMLGGAPSTMAPAIDGYLETNVALVGRVLAAAENAGCRRIFFDSSEQVFGDAADRQAQTPWAEPVAGNYYGATKIIAEKLLRLWSARSMDRSVQVLRYSRVRASDTRDVIRVMLGQALEGKPLRIFGNSTRRLAFVHIDDVLDANLAALGRVPGWAIYHVGADRPVSLLELAVRIREIAHAATGAFSTIEVGSPGAAFEPHVVGMRWEPTFRELGLPNPRGLDEMILETLRDLAGSAPAAT